MSNRSFTLRKVKQTFGLTTVEGGRFLPETAPITPSTTLSAFLEESLPLAIATCSEKARSELIISPVLVEVRKILNRQISLFSGEDFTVDLDSGVTFSALVPIRGLEDGAWQGQLLTKRCTRPTSADNASKA